MWTQLTVLAIWYCHCQQHRNEVVRRTSAQNLIGGHLWEQNYKLVIAPKTVRHKRTTKGACFFINIATAVNI